ncbi:hypothetical protein A6K24_18905 [Metabacillus litoralis]|uniref:GyrI-like small molecule binding domain-containing protein n=1 Tax=Metabacillus litoralis TaxID=152268 RepID=A0A179T1E1_9BACI|nr:hypothetical protein A6K24_18905 [Metabacillus litoralis]
MFLFVTTPIATKKRTSLLSLSETSIVEFSLFLIFLSTFEVVLATPKSIQSTWNFIFTEWFPQSGYEHNGSVEFELYDERCYESENKEMDIYIPVKKTGRSGIKFPIIQWRVALG